MRAIWKGWGLGKQNVPTGWVTNKYDHADEIKLLHSGNDFFDHLLEMINGAKFTLHIQTFTLGHTETGIMIADALKEAARRGVKVYVLVDAVGSKNIPLAFISDLRNAKVKFRFYSPFFSRRSVRFGRRLHHKIAVADGRVALIGGINLDNEYRGNDTVPPWLDFAVQVKGKVCEKPEQICLRLWGKKFADLYKSADAIAPSGAIGPLVAFRRNDRFRLKREVSNSYIRSITKAQKQVIIIAGYFLPGNRLMEALTDAAERGVEVNIIVAATSDVQLFPVAISYLYQKCISKGINVYEWHETVLHAKAAVVDDIWTTIGSFNLNYLSAYGSIEANIDVLDEQFANTFQRHLALLIKERCNKVTDESYKNRKWYQRLRLWLVYHFVRYTLIVISFLPYFNLFNKRKKKITDTKA